MKITVENVNLNKHLLNQFMLYFYINHYQKVEIIDTNHSNVLILFYEEVFSFGLVGPNSPMQCDKSNDAE